VRGPEHPDTLVAKVQLGEILIDLGRHAEAAQLLEQAAEGLERVQGPTSPYAASAWSDYSVAACGGEQAAAGLAAAQRVAVIRAAALPATDWHRKSTQVDIGYCLERLHRYREAEPVLAAAAHDLEATRGSGFYTTQLAYKGLRELYAHTGRTADAARMAALIKP
jgi:tetratricopeptide (TPR) repeat protein